MQIPHPVSKISPFVTLSLGVTSVIPNQDLTAEALIASADQALYEAKKQGRDRVILAALS